MKEQYSKIFANSTLNSVIDSLIFHQFGNDLKLELEEVNMEKLRKCVWLASILAQSPDELHRQKAQTFASLMFLQYPSDRNIQKAAYIIYSRAGNLTASKFLIDLGAILPNGFQFHQSFGYLLDTELGIERLSKSIGEQNEEILLTDFQSNLWHSLNNNNKIAISAPTSAGKSFIIQRYIKKRFTEAPALRILYLVSSRALLSQVSEEFRLILPTDVQINTSFIFNDESPIIDITKHLLILTPERCLKLLQGGYRKEFPLDMVFIDEIQNIEESEGRGVLLEYVLNELNQIWPESKKIIAGPLIRNTKDVFIDLFRTNCAIAHTTKSPVFHIKTIVRPGSENNIRISVVPHDPDIKSTALTVTTPFNLTKELDKGVGEGLSKVVKFFTTKGQSIIYAPKTNLVQTWAKNLANSIEDSNTDAQLEELIEFLTDEIHPKYFLIDCLRKLIAFHHAKLPDIVRKEIEDLFIAGKIKFLYCTSTLLEGVNLPANNLFIIKPEKRSDPLSPFEFGNLIGRAGRIKDSLYGTIYCIERDELWARDYYETHYEKNVTSSSRRALRKPTSILNEITKATNEIKESAVKNVLVLLRQKFVQGESQLRQYLDTKLIEKQYIDPIVDGLKESLQSIKVPVNILRLNPSVDPLLQNRLFEQITNEGVDKWIFHPNPNFYSRITSERNTELDFENTSMFWQLNKIIEKLDEIFTIRLEAFKKYDIGLSIASICSYATQWLENKSYKELIAADIRFYSKHTNPNKRIDPDDASMVNRRINEVIKIHSTMTTFILVKYLKLLNDLLTPFIGIILPIFETKRLVG